MKFTFMLSFFNPSEISKLINTLTILEIPFEITKGPYPKLTIESPGKTDAELIMDLAELTKN